MDFASRIRSTLTRDLDEDVVEELAQHAAAMYARARADGVPRDEAIRRVDVQIALWTADAGLMGRRTGREAAVVAPPADRSGPLTALWHDVRYGVRLLRRQWAFSLLVVTTMALGVGATGTLFGVTYGVLMKPLPWPGHERLALLRETRAGQGSRFGPFAFSNAAFHAWRAEAATIEGIAAWSGRTHTLTGAGEPERIQTAAVTPNLFPLLGTLPLAGQLFDEAEAAAPVVMLSEGLWRRRFGGDPGVIGRLLEMDGRPHVVAAVIPGSRAYPDPDTQAWVPLDVPQVTGDSLRLLNAFVKLRPGVTPEQAAAEAAARAVHAPDTPRTAAIFFGADGPIAVEVRPMKEVLGAEVRQPLLVLLAAVALLFAGAVVNLAGVQLARAASRVREMAIRAALGAGIGRVTRQLLVENLLLGAAGGVAGLLLALALHRALPSLLPADFPRLQDLGMDPAVIAFVTLLALGASLMVGLAPALRARRVDLQATLAHEAAGASGGSRSARGRLAIMTAQVAVACVLLVGASLLGRSFLELLHADRGIDPTNVLVARALMPPPAYTPERRADVLRVLLERLRARPDVVAVTISDGAPLGIFNVLSFPLDGREVNTTSRSVLPGHFDAMGMRFVSGRDFTDADAVSGAALIVNRTFARRYLPHDEAGQRVRMGLDEQVPHREIVGIVDDVRHNGVMAEPEPEIYQLRRLDAFPSPVPTLVIRTAGDPLAFVPPLRALARHEAPDIAFDAIGTLDDQVAATIARPRLYAALMAGFATLALLIVGVGLFGTISFAVAQRSRELAVRSALGARPADLLGLVLRQGLASVALGLLAGLAAAAGLVRFVASMLYGVTTADPVTYTAVPLVLLAAALLASLAPALRAARTDPLRVLKG